MTRITLLRIRWRSSSADICSSRTRMPCSLEYLASGVDLVVRCDTRREYSQQPGLPADWRWVNRGSRGSGLREPQRHELVIWNSEGQSLYGSLSDQLKSPNSFASQVIKCSPRVSSTVLPRVRCWQCHRSATRGLLAHNAASDSQISRSRHSTMTREHLGQVNLT